MYKEKTFIAIIPARGGSKGIPKKNIINVGGKPLIQYTIDEAKNSKYLDRIIVSTDDKEIADLSVNCGAEVPFLRPKELAQDNSKTIDVVINVLNEIKKCQYDYLVLLQPTQPLRKSFHIDETIELIVEKDEESLVSVSEVNEHPILMRTIDKDGRLNSLLGLNSTIRRQDFTKFYKVNGAIYINQLKENFNNNISLNDNKLAYIMEKKFDLDIDEPDDLNIFKLRLSNIE